MILRTAYRSNTDMSLLRWYDMTRITFPLVYLLPLECVSRAKEPDAEIYLHRAMSFSMCSRPPFSQSSQQSDSWTVCLPGLLGLGSPSRNGTPLPSSPSGKALNQRKTPSILKPSRSAALTLFWFLLCVHHCTRRSPRPLGATSSASFKRSDDACVWTYDRWYLRIAQDHTFPRMREHTWVR